MWNIKASNNNFNCIQYSKNVKVSIECKFLQFLGWKRTSYKMYFGQRFHMPIKLQKIAFNSKMFVRDIRDSGMYLSLGTRILFHPPLE